MRLPFHSPRWVTVTLLVAVVGVVGMKLLHHSSKSHRDPLASAFTLDDPRGSSLRATPDVAGGITTRDGKPSGRGSPTGGSPVGSGVHISAMSARDGSWRVVGSQATPQAADAAPTGDTDGEEPTGYPPSSEAPPVTPTGTGGQKATLAAYKGPSFFGQDIFEPLPGAQSRAVAFSEWESYRTDVEGRNILVTTDDSNFFRNRAGKLNANTGDTDASGLNVTDAADSVILGTESADSAPWQVDPPDAGAGDSDSDDDSAEAPDADEPGDAPDEDAATSELTTAPMAARPLATAAVASNRATPAGSNSSDDSEIPALLRLLHANGSVGTAVHTDEGTTVASADDAIVIGGDGYDDDDNRAMGNNITITRDDGNVVVGGTGDVNAQIGDSEQGAVIMGVQRVFIQGGGAY